MHIGTQAMSFALASNTDIFLKKKNIKIYSFLFWLRQKNYHICPQILNKTVSAVQNFSERTKAHILYSLMVLAETQYISIALKKLPIVHNIQ